MILPSNDPSGLEFDRADLGSVAKAFIGQLLLDDPKAEFDDIDTFSEKAFILGYYYGATQEICNLRERIEEDKLEQESKKRLRRS